MSVGKEALVTLEQLARRQGRIYQDACDYGIWESDAIRTMIVGALAELRELEGGKSSRWSSGTAYETRLGYEIDGGLVQGVKVKVARCVDQKTKKAFYSIDLTRATWAPNAPI